LRPVREKSVLQVSQRAAWWAGIYPLSLAVMVGLGWMDSTWYHGLQGRVPSQALDGVARSVGDMLLFLLSLVLLAGGIAACLWNGLPRLLCAASVAVLCLELLLPLLASAIPGGSFYLAEAGPLLRSGIQLAALALALLAMRRGLS
jgi:hypothetical protein